MSESTLDKFEAAFYLTDQGTSMVITKEDFMRYAVRARSRLINRDGFPVRSVTEREGFLFDDDAQNLVDAVLAKGGDNWFHHYREPNGIGTDRRWCVRARYTDGSISRWEGYGVAPRVLNDVYDKLVSSGMPPLAGYQDIACRIGRCGRSEALDRVGDYLKLMTKAGGKRGEGANDAGLRFLADEFLDDVKKYLRGAACDERGERVEVKVVRNRALDTLLSADVTGASRQQLMELFASLVYRENARDAIVTAFRRGTLGVWFQRMREIPHEEARRWALEREERERRQREAVDKAIAKKVEAGTVFTSREIAEAAGSSASMASGRIRRLVREGIVKTVGDELPRQYQAAREQP